MVCRVREKLLQRRRWDFLRRHQLLRKAFLSMRPYVTSVVFMLAVLGVTALFSPGALSQTGRNSQKHGDIPAKTPSPAPKSPRTNHVYTYKIVKDYPHDKAAFTQGLAFEDGLLFESTGRRGESSLRKTELETGRVLQIHRLPARFWGEGMTVFKNRVIQLTWQSNVGFVYDKDSLALLKTFRYPTEGWGITHDGKRLIMSDGTSTLHFLHPETLNTMGRVNVYDNHGPVKRLNELEYIQGQIYANVWPTDRVARIDLETGQVVGWIDLAGILGPEPGVDVLNGIAYDKKNDRLFVTGKMWPKLFQIELGMNAPQND